MHAATLLRRDRRNLLGGFGGLKSDACNPQTLIAGPLSCCCKKHQHLLPTSPSLRPRAASPTAPLR